MSCFGRVKSALDSSPLFTPDFFASCLLIEGGLQIPRFHRSNVFLQRIANPLGRLTEDRRLTENLRYLRNLRDFLQRPNRSSFRFNSVRNPWSKNALLTQRNPMKKYPGEEWVKSGEEWRITLHLSDPQCL